jgi:site-specific recombinase XerD
MTATLRALDDTDARRASAVSAYLDRFEASPTTRRTMWSALRSIVALFPERPADIGTFPWELASDPQFFDEVQHRVVAAYAPATASKLMSALRQLLRVMARHELVDADLLWSTVETSRKVPRVEALPTRGLRTGELRSMLVECRRDANRAIGARDAAVLAVMAATGARRTEIASLERRRLDLDELVVELRVKGGGWRAAALHPAAAEYLQIWMSYGVSGSRAFCAVQKNGLVLPDQAIGDKAIWKIVNKRRDLAGLDQRITPHSFRRWFVSSLLENGVDLLTVTRAVGHKNPTTTRRYDRREEAALRQVVLGLDLPTVEEVNDDP